MPLVPIPAVGVFSRSSSGIPPEGFGKLKKLRVLDLSQNRLQGLPADCGEYCMQELNLRNNQITAIPVALASASLQILRLESNAVAREGIPPEYDNILADIARNRSPHYFSFWL